MSRPRVTVVIPLYNHAKFIEAAIDSVLAQSLPAVEIVVVDDGSTDRSASVVAALAKRHRQIILWSKPNAGAHAAINDGLHRATGELVAILNSDDLYHPQRLSRMAEVFGEDLSVDAVCTSLGFIDGAGRRIDNPWRAQAAAFYRETGDLGLSLINGNFVMTTSNLMLRRSALEALGGFSALRYAHDLDFLLRLAAGRGLRVLDEPLMSYRMHDSNTIDEGHLKVKAEWAAATAMFLHRLWAPSQPPDWPRAERIMEVLTRHALVRPVLLCLAYFRQNPGETLERHPFFRDVHFRALLARSVE